MDPELAPKRSLQLLPAAVFLGLILLLGALLYLLYGEVRQSFSASSKEELPSPQAQSTPSPKASKPTAPVPSTATPISGVTEEPAAASQISFDLTGDKLTLRYKDHDTLYMTLTERTVNNWFALINDPYSALIVFGCNPFSKEDGAPINSATNVTNLRAASGEWNLSALDNVKLFPFFSSAPTTVGIARGLIDASGQFKGLELYFVDAYSGDAAMIASEQCVFPTWLSRAEFPPAYSTGRYIYLVPNLVGDNVTAQIKSWVEGEYKDDSDRFTKLALEEFSRAKLSSAELGLLAGTDISNITFTDEQYKAIAKLVRLFYYGKVLGKNSALQALISQLHPSIQKALRENQDLKL